MVVEWCVDMELLGNRKKQEFLGKSKSKIQNDYEVKLALNNQGFIHLF